MLCALSSFKEVWAVDFEFRPMDGREGNRPDIHCLVAHELKSGRKLRLWRDELGPLPPYSVGPDSLFVAFYASAEVGCHLALGWPKPARILDLFTEFRCHTNGAWDRQKKAGLLDALIHFGIPCIDAAEKDEMRALALRGGPYSEEERLDLLNYCEGDVESCSQATAGHASRHQLALCAGPGALHGSGRHDGAQRHAD